ncbi:ATP-binding cassette domain-containing protein, partial [Rhizobium ruizarguesonis]
MRASRVETRGLTALYGDVQAVFGVDIRREVGETIAVIGANGAGRSTLMRSLAGVIANSAEMGLQRG